MSYPTEGYGRPVIKNKGLAHIAMLRAEAHNTANASASIYSVIT